MHPGQQLIAQGVVGRSGEIIFANTHALALFGPDAELVGATVEDLIPDDARSTHEGRRIRYQDAPTVRPMGAGLLLRARRCDGSEFPVSIRGMFRFVVEAGLITHRTDYWDSAEFVRQTSH